MKTFTFIFVLTLSFTLCFAQDCPKYSDPFAPEARMPFGPYQGTCLDLSVRRSFKILTNKEVKIAGLFPQDVFYIANVSHNQKFWIAKIDKNFKVRRIVFQMEKFPPEWVAAHTQLRIQFTSPIQLYRQDDTRITNTTNELIFSVEAVSPINGPRYGLFKGTQDKFGLAYRMTSIEEKARHIGIEQDHTTYQWVLALEEYQRDSIFNIILNEYHDPEMSFVYHTLKKNCTNELFDIMGLGLGFNFNRFERFQTSLPIISAKILRKLNLIDHSVKLPLFNVEAREVILPEASYAPQLTLQPQ